LGFLSEFVGVLYKAVKEYKEELSAAQEQNEMLTKIVGKMVLSQ
jgi:hypothetical protein